MKRAVWATFAFAGCLVACAGQQDDPPPASREELASAAAHVATAFYSTLGSCCNAHTFPFSEAGCSGTMSAHLEHWFSVGKCPPLRPTDASIQRCADASPRRRARIADLPPP